MEHSTPGTVQEIRPRDVTMALVSRADSTVRASIALCMQPARLIVIPSDTNQCTTRLSEVISDSGSEWTTIETKNDA